MPGVDRLRRSLSHLRADFEAANVGGLVSLAGGLREFFRETLTLEQAREHIERALEHREQRFLQLARTRIHQAMGLNIPIIYLPNFVPPVDTTASSTRSHRRPSTRRRRISLDP